MKRFFSSRRTLAFFAGLCLIPCSTPLWAEASRPFARTRLEPGPTVTVGEPISVVVEVLVPTWFTAAPRFPDLDVRDSLTVFVDRGTNFTESIDGETWAGQSRSYTVYPQRAGRYEIPEIPVRLKYFAARPVEASVSPPLVSFDAHVPPEAEGLAYFIATSRLDLVQSFDREVHTLQVGEAFTRTVTVTVRDALSMVVPPLPRDPTPGLGTYHDPPRVEDRGGERGETIVGERVESVTYVAEREGNYRLAPIELAWWDVGARRLRRATLPALEFRVVAASDPVAAIPLPPDEPLDEKTAETARGRVSPVDAIRRWGIPLAAAGLIVLLLLRLARRYVPRVRKPFAEARIRRSRSEVAYYRRFRRAARSGDPRATWRQWTSWLDRIREVPGVATVREFVGEVGDVELANATASLERSLFTRSPERPARADWSGRRLHRRVARARRARLRPEKSRGARRELPLLNPNRVRDR